MFYWFYPVRGIYTTCIRGTTNCNPCDNTGDCTTYPTNYYITSGPFGAACDTCTNKLDVVTCDGIAGNVLTCNAGFYSATTGNCDGTCSTDCDICAFDNTACT